MNKLLKPLHCEQRDRNKSHIPSYADFGYALLDRFLEYIPTTLGESLQKLMPAMRGDQQQWKMLFLGQILDGLAYIHGQGVIHGVSLSGYFGSGTCSINESETII